MYLYDVLAIQRYKKS